MGRETRVAWRPAEVTGGGRRRGPARAGRGRIPGRRAGPAGLPPGTSSIHARLGASRQVRPHAAARPRPALRLRPAPRPETMPPPHIPKAPFRPGVPGPRATRARPGRPPRRLMTGTPGSATPLEGRGPRTYRNRANGPHFHVQRPDRYLAASSRQRPRPRHLVPSPAQTAWQRRCQTGVRCRTRCRGRELPHLPKSGFTAPFLALIRSPSCAGRRSGHCASLRPETPPYLYKSGFEAHFWHPPEPSIRHRHRSAGVGIRWRCHPDRLVVISDVICAATCHLRRADAVLDPLAARPPQRVAAGTLRA
jgi:hypothetical protein